MSIANISLSGYAVGPAYFSQVDSKDGSGRKLDLATFKIAHNPRAGGGKTESSVFIRVSAWGVQAQIARDRIQKGTFISVNGPLTKNEVAMKDGNIVQDSQGNPVINMEITARDLEVPREAGSSGESHAGGYEQSRGSSNGRSSGGYNSNSSFGGESAGGGRAHELAASLVTDDMEPPF